jgi:catechol 2,3-dioxygenase
VGRVTAHAPDTAPRLPATLRLGPVRLTVADLDRSIDWYRSVLGIHVQRRDGGVAELGDGAEPAVVLLEDREARPASRHAGLYHYALLYPSREELARAARRLALARARLHGMSDHGTHEAIYLPDADGIGIELAADRPRAEWPDLRDEFARGGPRPLDVDALVALAPERPPEHVAEGLRVGHVHLHVGDVGRAFAFYRDVLGFEEQVDVGTAGFVSAGGYHHHLAFNVWRGRGVGPAPAHTVGLERWTIRLPAADDVAALGARVTAAGGAAEPIASGLLVRDPWEIAVAVVATP